VVATHTLPVRADWLQPEQFGLPPRLTIEEYYYQLAQQEERESGGEGEREIVARTSSAVELPQDPQDAEAGQDDGGEGENDDTPAPPDSSLIRWARSSSCPRVAAATPATRSAPEGQSGSRAADRHSRSCGTPAETARLRPTCPRRSAG